MFWLLKRMAYAKRSELQKNRTNTQQQQHKLGRFA